MPIVIGNIKLYTLEELSEALGVTIATLRGYIAKKELQARKVGGRFLVTEEALQEFLKPKDKEKTDILPF